MADITLTCKQCGKVIVISEHVSQKAIACSECGAEIPLPEKPKTGGVRLRPKNEPKPEPVVVVQQEPAQPASKTVKAVVTGVKQRTSVTSVKFVFSWLLFAVLGCAAYFVRYRFGIPGMDMGQLIEYGMVAIGVVYVLIILLALKDNMFDALMCIVIPLYPFYYIFLVSNAVFVRAIVGALLIGFGLDFAMLLQVKLTYLYDRITYLIHNA